MDGEDNISELVRAIADGDLEYVKEAIATGDDVNDPEEAPLLVATAERQKEIARFLLESGADPNFPHLPEWSCLTQAVACDDLEFVNLLCDYGARVRPVSSDLWGTELHLAAENGQLEMIRLLVERADGLQALEKFDSLDCTPLISAAREGQLDAVRLLWEFGADVNALVQMTRDDAIGYTAISRATWRGHVDVVEFLLEKGADPYRPGWMWTNAFHQLEDTEADDVPRLEKALHIPELKRPAQTPHRQQIEHQLAIDLKYHGCETTPAFEWKATKAVGKTFTVRGKPLRSFDNLRVLDKHRRLVAEGDVEFLVLTREIDFKAFWCRLKVGSKTRPLAAGVPSHVVETLTDDQKSWIVMDSRNYHGRLKREDLDRIR